MQLCLWVLRSAAQCRSVRAERKEIQRVFSSLYRDVVRFVLVQGGEPLLRRDLPEILEDVAFCERLIRVTTILLLSPPIITEARKFLKMGVWRSFLLVLLIILHVEFRLPALPRTFFQDAR